MVVCGAVTLLWPIAAGTLTVVTVLSLAGFLVISTHSIVCSLDRIETMLKPMATLKYDFSSLAANSYAASLLAARHSRVRMPVSSYSMEPVNITSLLELVEREQSRRVVELGSGMSTILIAQLFREQECGHVTAVEHDKEWAERCTYYLAECGLTDYATVLYVPLQDTLIDGNGARWYDFSQVDHCLHDIDVLVVDGPPRSYGEKVRWPAWQYFRSRMASNAFIFVDDVERNSERSMVQAWTKGDLGLDAEFRTSISGYCILRFSAEVSRIATTQTQRAEVLQ